MMTFLKALEQHKASAGVISAMEKAWPGLKEENALELSAKVNSGEMKWLQDFFIRV